MYNVMNMNKYSKLAPLFVFEGFFSRVNFQMGPQIASIDIFCVGLPSLLLFVMLKVSEEAFIQAMLVMLDELNFTVQEII